MPSIETPNRRGPITAEIQYVEGTTIVLDVGGVEKRIVAHKQTKIEGIEGKPNATIADLSNYDVIEFRGLDAEVSRIKVISRVTQEESLARSKAKARREVSGFNTGDMQPRSVNPSLTKAEANDAAHRQQMIEDTAPGERTSHDDLTDDDASHKAAANAPKTTPQQPVHPRHKR